MNKRIDFALNNFPIVPHQLRFDKTISNAQKREFEVDLARLYHHYHTDSYDVKPLDPNHTNFEYLRFLSPCADFRFKDDGPGRYTGKKRTISTELGQAFCRYFLYEFCNVTYFAHMNKVLGKSTHPAFNGMQIIRTHEGDVPDYLCAEKVNKPLIAEAKGRYRNISFTNVEFSSWRRQFQRIKVLDKVGVSVKAKGYIVATRFATEANQKSTKSKVSAEDPETEGELNGSDNNGLGRGCLAIHYSRLVSKLGLNLLSLSLEEGFVVPSDLQFTLPVWQCNYPPLNKQKFVGGFISEVEPNLSKLENGHFIFYPNIVKLGFPSPAFYGLKVDTFRALRNVCLGNWDLLDQIEELPDTEFRPSNLAWLRDGSITGALDFFELIGTETF